MHMYFVHSVYISILPVKVALEGVSWSPLSHGAGPWTAGERTGPLSWRTEGSLAGAAWELMTAALGETATHSQVCSHEANT